MDKILENIVRDHRDKNLDTWDDGEENREDLVDILLRLQKNGDLENPLSDSIVKATILNIFSAGSESSYTTMEWVMSELVKNPRVMAKMQFEVRRVFDGIGYVDEASIHELKYLISVIKETLHLPVPLLLPRECGERCEINGYEIPTRSKVMTESLFIPFGGGRRTCPGINFGIVNIEFSLANLLFHFDWKMAKGNNPEELIMTESFGLSVKRKFGVDSYHLSPIYKLRPKLLCTLHISHNNT